MDFFKNKKGKTPETFQTGNNAQWSESLNQNTNLKTSKYNSRIRLKNPLSRKISGKVQTIRNKNISFKNNNESPVHEQFRSSNWKTTIQKDIIEVKQRMAKPQDTLQSNHQKEIYGRRK